MGLDVSGFSHVKWASFAEPVDGTDTIRLINNTDFPKHAGTIRDGWYTYDESESGPSMGYGGYNRFREDLARLAGYSIREAWAGLHEGEPFYEIVNFSDCEGTICAAMCKKLERDFTAFDERAQKLDQWFYDKYVEMHAAIKCAAKDGALKFY